jgi:hypothetical protein
VAGLYRVFAFQKPAGASAPPPPPAALPPMIAILPPPPGGDPTVSHPRVVGGSGGAGMPYRGHLETSDIGDVLGALGLAPPMGAVSGSGEGGDDE